MCVSTHESRKYIHAAVSKGNCVCVAGHTLLLTIVSAGGRSHRITRGDEIWVDGLSTGWMPGKMNIFHFFGEMIHSFSKHLFKLHTVWCVICNLTEKKTLCFFFCYAAELTCTRQTLMSSPELCKVINYWLSITGVRRRRSQLSCYYC